MVVANIAHNIYSTQHFHHYRVYGIILCLHKKVDSLAKGPFFPSRTASSW